MKQILIAAALLAFAAGAAWAGDGSYTTIGNTDWYQDGSSGVQIEGGSYWKD